MRTRFFIRFNMRSLQNGKGSFSTYCTFWLSEINILRINGFEEGEPIVVGVADEEIH